MNTKKQKKQNNNASQKLKDMARNWPRPGELVYHIEKDHVWLHKIRLPLSERGVGTSMMARFLALTDQLNLPVCLTADPISIDDDQISSLKEPDTYHLVRWYQRFGFDPLGPSEDGFLMQRDSSPGSSFDDIIKTYNNNKKNNDLSSTDFYQRWAPSSERKLGL